MQAQPFICDIAHSGRGTALDPGHEGPIEFECSAALARHELPDFLSVPVAGVDWGGAGDWPSMPVEAHIQFLGWGVERSLALRGAQTQPETGQI